ncbi:MAG: hypothetical protein ACRECW_17510 [Phyllobacterium sp.]
MTAHRWRKSSIYAAGLKGASALLALGFSGAVHARDLQVEAAFVDSFNNLVLRDTSGARYIIVDGGEQAAADLARRIGRKIPVETTDAGPRVINPPGVREVEDVAWDDSQKPSVAIVVDGGLSQKRDGWRSHRSSRFGHHRQRSD